MSGGMHTSVPPRPSLPRLRPRLAEAACWVWLIVALGAYLLPFLSLFRQIGGAP